MMKSDKKKAILLTAILVGSMFALVMPTSASETVHWKLIEITNPTDAPITGNFAITVSPSHEGVHLAGSDDMTFFYNPEGQPDWWTWLNVHWKDMDWFVSNGSLTPINFSDLLNCSPPTIIYDDPSPGNYSCFRDNCEMCDFNFTSTGNDPDIFGVLPWVDNTITYPATIPANFTAYFLLKIVLTEPGPYCFEMTGPENVTINPSGWCIPEQVPALTPLGIAALVGLLSVIALSTILTIRKRR
ncbi:MAG TPA: hypothetical protein VMW67_01405 [Desulfobacteria bacterium]|nr:hypothetical protein [Desulfobacteria bacterium]